jgi:penicillin-binding protein 1A
VNASRKTTGRRRPGKGTFTTRSGNLIKAHRSFTERFRASKDAKARRRAAYLSSLPKNKFHRILYRMHPKRLAAYWFSRQGAMMALKITGIAILVGFIFIVGLFAYFRKDLPNLTNISGDSLGGNITYYARDGETVLWQDYDAVKRIPVPGNEISEYVKQATIAIEDQNFYDHGAFDIGGIARAAIHNLLNRDGTVQGGSTISQQVVKLNQNWTNERSITRKIKELILAVELEREYSKDDILNGYLNIAPYGTIQYGVEAAARDYFHKSAKDLNLAESAFLAAMPQSPDFYSPYGTTFNPEALIGRQHYILDQMVELGMVSQEQANNAKGVDILAQVHPPAPSAYDGIRAPYFVLAAKEQLEKKYGGETVRRGGWKVTTTLDLEKQRIAEEQVQQGMARVRAQGGDVAAFTAVDVETAQVVAMVGGPGLDVEGFGQVNYARQELPPGSSFKPYDYAALIEHSDNVGAGSVLYDTQGELPGYPCTNRSRPSDRNQDANCLWDYDFRYPGPVTLRYGLAASRNVPAVKAMLTVGVEKTIETAESMGLVSGYNCYEDAALTQEAQCFGSSAIGDGAYLRQDEHVNAFATFSRMGTYLPHSYILKIVDASGDVIDEWQKPEGKQAIRPETAYIISDILSDPRASYMSRKIQNYNGWRFAAKTGTTNDSKDGWMMGFSSKYAAGVWVGYHDRSVALEGFMETMTGPIWSGWMRAVHDGMEPQNWERPPGVKEVPAYVQRNHVGGSTIEPGPSQDLAPSWYQAPEGGSGGSEAIDIVSNKLATSCTPELARRTERGANDNRFSVDIFVGTAGANRNDTDDVHNCNDTKPSITLTASSGSCEVGEPCSFTATVTRGTHPLSGGDHGGEVKFFVNGNEVRAHGVSGSPASLNFTFTPTSTGSVTVRAQIIDSVLYEASDSSTVSVSGGGGGGGGGNDDGPPSDDDDNDIEPPPGNND